MDHTARKQHTAFTELDGNAKYLPLWKNNIKGQVQGQYDEYTRYSDAKLTTAGQQGNTMHTAHEGT